MVNFKQWRLSPIQYTCLSNEGVIVRGLFPRNESLFKKIKDNFRKEVWSNDSLSEDQYRERVSLFRQEELDERHSLGR